MYFQGTVVGLDLNECNAGGHMFATSSGRRGSAVAALLFTPAAPLFIINPIIHHGTTKQQQFPVGWTMIVFLQYDLGDAAEMAERM